ncbi:uncharacterized protein [Dermacentor albipictus]|uniref:uncharacterized protein n=1 Tax=Dermacentor albipictus TaxID=60249 RepID=UPI0038FBFBC5
MDTTTSQTAPSAPKERRAPVNRSKKDKTPIMMPRKGPLEGISTDSCGTFPRAGGTDTPPTAAGGCGLQWSRRVCAAGAEAANAEAASFHQLLLQQNGQHHQQLVEELRATWVVQQQVAAEMRGLREATGLIATTLCQLLAALARLREQPQRFGTVMCDHGSEN